jgi:hypothetical protein
VNIPAFLKKSQPGKKRSPLIHLAERMLESSICTHWSLVHSACLCPSPLVAGLDGQKTGSEPLQIESSGWGPLGADWRKEGQWDLSVDPLASFLGGSLVLLAPSLDDLLWLLPLPIPSKPRAGSSFADTSIGFLHSAPLPTALKLIPFVNRLSLGYPDLNVPSVYSWDPHT